MMMTMTMMMMMHHLEFDPTDLAFGHLLLKKKDI